VVGPLGDFQLSRLASAYEDKKAGRQQPVGWRAFAPLDAKLRGGYADALQLQLNPLASGAVVTVHLHGQSAVVSSAAVPDQHALASGPPLMMLRALFGQYTADMPSPEEVDPVPVAAAFWQGVRRQWEELGLPALDLSGPPQALATPTRPTTARERRYPARRNPARSSRLAGSTPRGGRTAGSTTRTAARATTSRRRRRAPAQQQEAGGAAP
jgi:hypothetical protein